MGKSTIVTESFVQGESRKEKKIEAANGSTGDLIQLIAP
jgi:hypothetical protein